MTFNLKTSIFFKNFLFIGLLLSLFPFYFLSVYNYPAGFDDFQNVVKVFKYGEWGYLQYVYNNWSGRFSSNALLAYLNPLKWEKWLIGFKLLPIITFTVFIFSVCYFLKALGRNSFTSKQLIIASVGFLTIYLFANPTISELFYWFTGVCVYTSGFISFLILFGSIINYLNSSNRGIKVFLGLLIVLMLIVTLGINEPVLLATLFLLFLTLAVSFLTKSPNRVFFLFLFGISCLIALFSIVAPGNAVRGASLHGTESMFSVTKLLIASVKSVYFSVTKIMSWSNNFVLLLVSIIIIPSCTKLLDSNLWVKKVTYIHPFFSLLFTVLFISLQVFTAFLGTGDAEPRIWSTTYFFFLIVWFYNVLVFISFFRDIVNKLPLQRLSYLNPLLIILLFFSSEGGIQQAFIDTLFRAPSYSKRLESRYSLIKSSTQEHLVMEPLFDRKYKYPKTIFVKEIGLDPLDKNNIYLSEYFKLKSIKLKKSPLE